MKRPDSVQIEAAVIVARTSAELDGWPLKDTVIAALADDLKEARALLVERGDKCDRSDDGDDDPPCVGCRTRAFLAKSSG